MTLHIDSEHRIAHTLHTARNSLAQSNANYVRYCTVAKTIEIYVVQLDEKVSVAAGVGLPKTVDRRSPVQDRHCMKRRSRMCKSYLQVQCACLWGI